MAVQVRSYSRASGQACDDSVTLSFGRVTVTEEGSAPFVLTPPSTAVISPDVPPTNHYTQTNLASDIAGLASHLDPNLVNPWGLCRSATSPCQKAFLPSLSQSSTQQRSSFAGLT